jgi:ferredoxin
MCEFCVQHGEGKRWYLQMKNYSRELLHAPLSSAQREIAGFDTRMAWLEDDYKRTVTPAGGINIPKENPPEKDAADHSPALTDEQILEGNKLTHFGQVVPLEDVEKVIQLTDSITRLPCACRYFNRGLANQRYCFGLGIDPANLLDKFPESAACLDVIEKAEALKLIHRFDDEGLMHSIWTGITPYVSGLCNCDGDCSAYQDYIKNRGRQTFFRAEYICQVDLDQCNGCRECMAQCQFGAQFYSSAMGKVTIDPKLCFGCGVCRAACPQGAISLLPRMNVKEAANIW